MSKPYIGGQAVLEGVMMRSPVSVAIVLRRRDGSLMLRDRPMKDGRKGLAKVPFIRGAISLVESLRLGNEALKYSAEQFQKDYEETPRKKPKAPTSILSAIGYSLFLFATADGEESTGSTTKKSASMMPMLLVMIAFMIALPQLAAAGIAKLMHLDLPVQSPAFQALTGAMKLTIVLGYLLLIRRLADIRRVFQYHGAEHKTISTYEAGEPLDVEHARKKTTLHPRCGTTFLVMVVLISIGLFTLLGFALPIKIDTGNKTLDNIAFLLVKIPFLPVLAGVTFEIQRLFAKYCTTGPLRVLLLPGFLVQKITTIEPDDDQLEVALASLRATLGREAGDGPDGVRDLTFASYDAIETTLPKAA